jgi:hypothetical protein
MRLRPAPARRPAGRSFPGFFSWSACALGLAGQMALVLRNPAKYQWDFRHVYLGPRAWEMGLDPYRIENLRLAGAGLHFSSPILPFIYPPQCLALFAGLAALPFRWAYYLYSALVAAAVCGIIVLGYALLRGSRDRILFPIFLLFGFALSLGFSIRSGNVAAFENVLLMLGLLAYSRRRWGWFACCVAAAAAFKLVPLAFLGLLLLAGERRALRAFFVSIAAIAAAAAATVASAPALAESFAASLSRVDSYRGPIDSSLLSLTRDLRLIVQGPASGPSDLWLWGTAAVSCVIVAVLALRRAARGRPEPGFSAMLLVLTYGVIAPRLLAYYFPLLLVPFWVLSGLHGRVGWGVRISAVLPVTYIARLFGHGPAPALAHPLWLVFDYWNWLVLAALWIVSVRTLLVHASGLPGWPGPPAALDWKAAKRPRAVAGSGKEAGSS